MWARIEDGTVRELTDADPAGRFHSSLAWVPAPDGTEAGDLYDGTVFSREAALPDAPEPVRYVPVATIRERLQEAGQWPAFATAVDGLPPEKRWFLLTLREGVAADDAEARALLTAIGADLDAVLAP